MIGRERRAHRLGQLANRALDTMPLGAALPRDWTDFGLDAVAVRLGVSITGRHTPDGMRLQPARILLAFLPALA